METDRDVSAPAAASTCPLCEAAFGVSAPRSPLEREALKVYERDKKDYGISLIDLANRVADAHVTWLPSEVLVHLRLHSNDHVLRVTQQIRGVDETLESLMRMVVRRNRNTDELVVADDVMDAYRQAHAAKAKLLQEQMQLVVAVANRARMPV